LAEEDLDYFHAKASEESDTPSDCETTADELDEDEEEEKKPAPIARKRQTPHSPLPKGFGSPECPGAPKRVCVKTTVEWSDGVARDLTAQLEALPVNPYAGAGAGAGGGPVPRPEVIDLTKSKKRKSEAAVLMERDGFKKSLKPSTSKRTGTRLNPSILYPNESEAEDEDSSSDAGGPGIGLEYEDEGDWVMTLEDSRLFKRQLQAELTDMDHLLNLDQKRSMQRDVRSLAIYIRKLKRERAAGVEESKAMDF